MCHIFFKMISYMYAQPLLSSLKSAPFRASEPVRGMCHIFLKKMAQMAQMLILPSRPLPEQHAVRSALSATRRSIGSSRGLGDYLYQSPGTR